MTRPAWPYVTQLNQVLVTLGAILLLLSGAIAVYLSTTITRPRDRLVAGARALGAGNFDYQLQRAGARVIRELGDAFDRMRCRLRSASPGTGGFRAPRHHRPNGEFHFPRPAALSLRRLRQRRVPWLRLHRTRRTPRTPRRDPPGRTRHDREPHRLASCCSAARDSRCSFPTSRCRSWRNAPLGWSAPIPMHRTSTSFTNRCRRSKGGSTPGRSNAPCTTCS